MFIPDDITREIKEKAVVEDVIGRFTELKKKGKDLTGECPFCNEKKLSVNPAKQIYKCWNCDKGGNNAVSFIMDKENLTYPEALKWLADFYNIFIPEREVEAPKAEKKKKLAKEEQPPVVTKKKSEFLKDTLRSIGLNHETNRVVVKWFNRASQSETVPLLTDDSDGNVEFLVYDINGFVVTYQKQTSAGPRDVPYKVVRLKDPVLNAKDGKMMKYVIPKGVGTRPFFPPALLDKFSNAAKIDTLFLTEGYKKAISGWVNGIDIVGLASISTYRDKETMQLHRDIVDLILKCQVKNVVILYDGDCADISAKAFSEEKDISLRPKQFFASANGIKELLKDYLKDYEISLYFGHINSDSVEGHPKGLDDIYEAMTKVQYEDLLQQIPNEPTNMQRGRYLLEAKQQAREILNADLYAFSRPGIYFNKIDITIGNRKLEHLLAIESANTFYLRHQDIIKDRKFTYFGTQYKYDQEKGECDIIIPAASKNYARVGDDYYENVPVPNKYKDMEVQLHRRAKTTIVDDHGKKFVAHIPKYKAFCNVPDHANYQQVIGGCFNMYSKFEHEPEEGDCSQTLDFIRHIFEEHYELGLDYLQLLYTRPNQILPILCLVSKENNTGKSTFSKWLKQVFKNNMAIVGNADLANDFNGFWSTKLIICCDEAFIEKKVIVERIKSLSTADRITMNQKGRDQVEIEFFGKFMMLTNNEDNFINATEDDIRYWVRKVKRPTKEIVNLDKQLVSEIPAFLNFLSTRAMSTHQETRMWFNPTLLITEAFRNVVRNSQSTVEKEIRTKIQSMFEDFSENIIMMTIGDIRREFFNNRYEEKYVKQLLKENMKMEMYWDWVAGEGGQQMKHYKNHRYSYPKWHTTYNNDAAETKRVDVKANGRPFVFLRPDFITPEQEALLDHDPEFLLMQTPVPPQFWRKGMLGTNGNAQAPDNEASDLPF